MGRNNAMNRNRLNPGGHDKTHTRIVWRDGLFRVECTGTPTGMRLTVYYEQFVMADEPVASAEAGWRRAAEICRELGDNRDAVARRGPG